MSKKKGPTDQVSNAERKQIRSRAQRFTIDLLKAELGEGIQVYQDTIMELYDGKARVRICLKCGEIDKAQNLTKDTHECTRTLQILPFPYLVTTTWLKLRAFFLGERYSAILQQLGFEPVKVEPIITSKRLPTEVSTEEIAEDAAETEDTS